MSRMILLLLSFPTQAEDWVQYGSATTATDGQPVQLYFSPESVRLEGLSVFVWTADIDSRSFIWSRSTPVPPAW